MPENKLTKADKSSWEAMARQSFGDAGEINRSYQAGFEAFGGRDTSQVTRHVATGERRPHWGLG